VRGTIFEVRGARCEVREFLVLIEAPEAAVATEHEFIAVEVFNLESYVVERLETIGVFYGGGVSRRGGDGVALYEQTVANVLEVCVDLAAQLVSGVIYVAEECYGAGEAEVSVVGARHAPLAQQVASIASLLTGGQQEYRRNKE